MRTTKAAPLEQILGDFRSQQLTSGRESNFVIRYLKELVGQDIRLIDDKEIRYGNLRAVLSDQGNIWLVMTASTERAARNFTSPALVKLNTLKDIEIDQDAKKSLEIVEHILLKLGTVDD